MVFFVRAVPFSHSSQLLESFQKKRENKMRRRSVLNCDLCLAVGGERPLLLLGVVGGCLAEHLGQLLNAEMTLGGKGLSPKI